MIANQPVKVAIVHNELSPYIIPLFVRLTTRSTTLNARLFVTRITSQGANHRLKFHCSAIKSGWFRRLGERLGIALPDFYLIREIRKFQPEAILLDGLSSIGTGLWLVATRRWHGAKCYWWSLGAIPGRRMTLRTAFGDMLQQFCARRCAGVIAYGTHSADFFRGLGVPAERITVGYNTIDEGQIQQDIQRCGPKVATLRQELGLGDAPVAVFCGTMKPGKKVELLLTAFARCRAQLVELKPSLVLIGDGPELASMQKLASKLGLAEVTRFVGRQDAEISSYFLLGQFAVMPGLGGLAINHAFAHALPVVCGPADGCELDLVKTDITGILLPMVTEAALAEAMASLFSRRADCERMGHVARQLVLQKISLENYARRVESAVLASFIPSSCPIPPAL